MTPFDYAKIINFKKELPSDLVGYDNFVMNRIYSNTLDSIFYANEINFECDKEYNFDYYYHGLSKGSRYGKWHKKAKEKKRDLDVLNKIMDVYNCSLSKAKEIYQVLENTNAINNFLDLADRGGKVGK